MLKEVLAGGRRLRLVGVRVTNLRDRAEPQATLSRWESLG